MQQGTMGAPSRAKLALVSAAERGADTLVQRCDTGDMAGSWRFEHVAVGSCDDVITMPWGDTPPKGREGQGKRNATEQKGKTRTEIKAERNET